MKKQDRLKQIDQAIRIQRLEEENAALRESLNAGKPEYTDHNCRFENGQWVVVCEKAEKTLSE